MEIIPKCFIPVMGPIIKAIVRERDAYLLLDFKNFLFPSLNFNGLFPTKNFYGKLGTC